MGEENGFSPPMRPGYEANDQTVTKSCYEAKGRKRQAVMAQLPEGELHSLSAKAEGFCGLRTVKHARQHHLQRNRFSYALTTGQCNLPYSGTCLQCSLVNSHLSNSSWALVLVPVVMGTGPGPSCIMIQPSWALVLVVL